MRVLVVATTGHPIAVKVVEAIKRHSASSEGPKHPTVEADVASRLRGQDVDELARSLKPRLPAYRVVFVTNIAMARAMQRVNAQIPIVFVGEADPVQFCIANSMQRPGRNVTGYMNHLPDEDFKMMEVLVQGFPLLKTIYLMVADSNFYVPDCGPDVPDPKPVKPPCVPGAREFEPSLAWWQQTPAVFPHAQRLGVQVKFMMLCRAADFALLGGLERGRHDVGFVFTFQGLFVNNAEALLAQVAVSRHPAIFGRRHFAQRGGLMSLEPILDADDDQAVIDILLQVLDGRSPANLPIQMPRGFRLSVNAAAAAAQGLQPSLQLLRRADEVILGAGR